MIFPPPAELRWLVQAILPYLRFLFKGGRIFAKQFYMVAVSPHETKASALGIQPEMLESLTSFCKKIELLEQTVKDEEYLEQAKTLTEKAPTKELCLLVEHLVLKRKEKMLKEKVAEAERIGDLETLAECHRRAPSKQSKEYAKTSFHKAVLGENSFRRDLVKTYLFLKELDDETLAEPWMEGKLLLECLLHS